MTRSAALVLLLALPLALRAQPSLRGDTTGVIGAIHGALRRDIGSDTLDGAAWYVQPRAPFVRKLAVSLGMPVRSSPDAMPTCPWLPQPSGGATRRGVRVDAYVRFRSVTSAAVTIHRRCAGLPSKFGSNFEADVTYRLSRVGGQRWRIVGGSARTT